MSPYLINCWLSYPPWKFPFYLCSTSSSWPRLTGRLLLTSLSIDVAEMWNFQVTRSRLYGRIHYFSGGFPLVSNLRVWFLNKYVWFWFQCHRLYLTHRDDSIILEDICDVKASSDQGTQEVFKGGQSTLLNPSCFDFTQCSAHHWLWLSPSIFPDNNIPDNFLRPARVHNEVNDPGHHSQNIGQHLASILDIRSTHNTPPEVQTTWSKTLSLIFLLQAHHLSD